MGGLLALVLRVDARDLLATPGDGGLRKYSGRSSLAPPVPTQSLSQQGHLYCRCCLLAFLDSVECHWEIDDREGEGER